MQEVHLTGHLVCADQREVALVEEHLPKHIELTRAESGCLLFRVIQTRDALIWSVEERFRDQAAFAMHQERVAASEWGLATARITRRYVIDGLDS